MLKFRTETIDLTEDVVLEEATCLPVLDSHVTVGKQPKRAARVGVNFVLCVAAMCVAILGGMHFSSLGMDWGYDLIESLFGQPEHNTQFWGAIYLSAIAAPVIYGSATLGVISSIVGGKKRWWFLLGSLLAAGFGLLAVQDSLECWLILLPAWSVACTLFYAFRWIHSELSMRTHATKLMACGLLAVCPMAVLEGQFHLPSGLPMYVAFLFGASACVPLAINNCKRDAAVAASMFAFLPITLFNAANVLYATVDMEALGWQAAASALTITAVTTLVTTLGAITGSSALAWRRSRTGSI